MRKIIVLEFITMDGVMQAPGGPEEDASGVFKYGGWSAPYNDDFFGKEMEKQMAGEYDLLLGRKTYDIFADYWPKHTEFWPQVNNITKYVISKTLTNPPWENSEVLRDDHELKKLKNSDGLPLQVYGSSILVQTLLKHDLVDEFWLKTYPLTLGQGKKLFTDGTIPAAFKLTSTKTSPSGVIFANYERDGEVKTGSFA